MCQQICCLLIREEKRACSTASITRHLRVIFARATCGLIIAESSYCDASPRSARRHVRGNGCARGLDLGVTPGRGAWTFEKLVLLTHRRILHAIGSSHHVLSRRSITSIVEAVLTKALL